LDRRKVFIEITKLNILETEVRRRTLVPIKSNRDHIMQAAKFEYFID